jgi:hypothetical protein
MANARPIGRYGECLAGIGNRLRDLPRNRKAERTAQRDLERDPEFFNHAVQ